ncbi:DUF6241 domain-containing protein [Clostridium sp.]|uniref:DUF6241 domain-containing protein n=1 Tax=Clostridium sp. TaxID=1506 RepID=UPI003F406C6B
MENGKLNKLVVSLVMVVALIGIGWGSMVFFEYQNKQEAKGKNNVVSAVSKTDGDENKSDESSSADNNTAEGVSEEAANTEVSYDFIHQLANGLIIAEDGQRWGVEEVTKDAIKTSIESFKGIDEYIVEELGKWLNGDFSNSVEVHNYCWDKLGGSVGRAIEVDTEGVTKAQNNVVNK